MIGTIDEVVVDCANPGPLATFWAHVLGGEARERDPNWWYVDPPHWSRLAFQRVIEAKTTKNRLHLDVMVTDISEATAQRLQLPSSPTSKGTLTATTRVGRQIRAVNRRPATNSHTR
jgi:hypothetical protein